MDPAEATPLRLRWSHRHPVHIAAVKLYNRVVSVLPFRITYAIGGRLRRNRHPYTLIRPGSRVLQVGAPRDTLMAGRSRGMYFALLSAPSGAAIIVEPEAESARAFTDVAAKQGLRHVHVVNKGAWSATETLRLMVDDAHQATNFVEGCSDYSPEEIERFRVVEIDADTVDNIVRSVGVGPLDLVSITTNGAEEEILKGMRETIDAGLRYIAIARTGPGLVELLRSIGFEFLAHDDRGYTFERSS